MPYLSHNYRCRRKSRLENLQEAGRFLGFAVLAIMATLFILGFAAYAFQGQAASGINAQLNYQGKLTDSSGQPVVNGSWNFRFRLYDASSGGNLLWTERWTATSTQVTTVNGIFSVALGSLADISGVDFNNDSLYLQVDLDADADGDWEEVFSSRKRLNATPYAFNTDTVDGFNATSTAAVANYLMALDDYGNLNLFGQGVSSTYATTSWLYVGQDSYVAGNATTAGSMYVGNDLLATRLGIATATPDFANFGSIIFNADLTIQNQLRIADDLYASDSIGEIRLGRHNGSHETIIWNPVTNRFELSDNVYILGDATATGNLEIGGYASTTNLVLSSDGVDLGTYNDLYVSGGNLFFNSSQITGVLGNSPWNYLWDKTISPTSTEVGIFVTASSTIAADFRVDGNATTTGSFSASEYYIGSDKVLAIDVNDNIMVGLGAGEGGSGVNSVYLGYQAGYNNASNASTLVGYQAGYSNVNPSGSLTAFGNTAGANFDGGGNSFFGSGSGANGSGYNNSAFGDLALALNTGSYNVALGYRSGYENIYHSIINIGYGATSTASHQLVIGGDGNDGYITDAYFGRGVESDNPIAAFTIHASGGDEGANGADLRLVGGTSDTGNAGNLILGHDGSSAIGFIGVATTTPGGWYGEKLTVDGSGLFDGDLVVTGNATSSHFYASNTLGLNGQYLNNWTDLNNILSFSSGNLFNQWLDTTSTVTFNGLNASTTANFDNILAYGSATTSGTLNVDGYVSSTEYWIGGNKILSISDISNTYLGVYAGENNSGNYVTFLGQLAGRDNSGSYVNGFGNSALLGNTGDYSTGLGELAGYQNTGVSITAVGASAGQNNSGTNLVALGGWAAVSNSGDNFIALGFNSGVDNNYSSSILIGDYTKATDNNQLVFGSYNGQTSAYVRDVYFGSGVTSTDPYGSVTIHASGGWGGDVNGDDLRLVGGLGAGTGLAGNLILGHDGSNAIGFIGVATTTPGGWYGEKLTVDGSGLFDGDLVVTGNATSSHFAASEICLGNDCITSWPIGGSSAWELYGTDPLQITPTTTGAGLYVTGTSTLATTTMALGSQIGSNDGNNLIIADYQVTGSMFNANFSLLTFNSPDLLNNPHSGGVRDAFGIIQLSDSLHPTIGFASKDWGDTLNEGLFEYNTTTHQFGLSNIDGQPVGFVVSGNATTTGKLVVSGTPTVDNIDLYVGGDSYFDGQLNLSGGVFASSTSVFGTLSSWATFDSGDLTFYGFGDYIVRDSAGSGDYVFRNISDEDLGLFADYPNSRWTFRDINSAPLFDIGYNGGATSTGKLVVSGTPTVDNIDLYVGGDSYFDGNVTTTGSLYVNGIATIGVDPSGSLGSAYNPNLASYKIYSDSEQGIANLFFTQVANTSAIGGAIGLGSNLSTASTSDQDISFLAAGNFSITYNSHGNLTYGYGGLSAFALEATSSISLVRGIGAQVTNGADNLGGTIGLAEGVYGYVENGPSNGGGENPTMAVARAVSAEIGLYGGTVTDAYGFYTVDPTGVGGTLDNLYGLYIEDQTRGSVQNYAIWTNDGQVRFDNLAATTTLYVTGSSYFDGLVTTTGNLNIGGYASTTNLVLGPNGSDLAGLNDLYVSEGNLFFDIYQLTGSNGLSFWQYAWDKAISPTSTNIGIFVTASSTIAADFRVDGNATTTGSQSAGEYKIGANTFVSSDGGSSTMVGLYAGTGNTGPSLTAFGYSAGSGNTGSGVTAIGNGAASYNSGSNIFVMGDSAGQSNTGQNLIAIGYYAGFGNAYNNSINIGSWATSTASYQLVVGGDNSTGYITDAYFGRGVESDNPIAAFTIHASGGDEGANGADLRLVGGTSDTGNAGNLILGHDGSNAIGFIGVATTTPGGWYGEKLTVDGSGLFDGDLRITGNATTSGSFSVGTDLLVLGTATSTFAGNVQIANGYDLQVSNIYAYSPLNILTDLEITGYASSTSGFHTQGGLYAGNGILSLDGFTISYNKSLATLEFDSGTLYNFDNQVRTESNLVVNTTTPSDFGGLAVTGGSYFADNVFFGDSIGIASSTPWATYQLAVSGNAVFDGDIYNLGNATTSHLAANEICLNGSCITSWLSSGGNPFDQWLDSTSSVEFADATITNSLNIGNYQPFWADYALTVAGGGAFQNDLYTGGYLSVSKTATVTEDIYVGRNLFVIGSSNLATTTLTSISGGLSFASTSSVWDDDLEIDVPTDFEYFNSLQNGYVIIDFFGEEGYANVGLYGYATSNSNNEVGITDIGLLGQSVNGLGVVGISQTSVGVQGVSQDGFGGYFFSENNIGLFVASNGDSPDSYALGVYGNSMFYGNVTTTEKLVVSDSYPTVDNYKLYVYNQTGYGIYGESESGYGVTGYSQTGYGGSFVSQTGYGIYGKSDSGYAGYFDGNVYIDGDLCLAGDCITSWPTNSGWEIFNGIGIRPQNVNSEVVIGTTVTSTIDKLQVIGGSYFDGRIKVGTTTEITITSEVPNWASRAGITIGSSAGYEGFIYLSGSATTTGSQYVGNSLIVQGESNLATTTIAWGNNDYIKFTNDYFANVGGNLSMIDMVSIDGAAPFGGIYNNINVIGRDTNAIISLVDADFLSGLDITYNPTAKFVSFSDTINAGSDILQYNFSNPIYATGTSQFDELYVYGSATSTNKFALATSTGQEYELGLSSWGAGSQFMYIQGQKSGEGSFAGLFSKDGDGSDMVGYYIIGYGSPDDSTNFEELLMTYNPYDDVYDIATVGQGTGTTKPLRFSTGFMDGSYQIALHPDNSIQFGGNASSTGYLALGSNINSSILSTLSAGDLYVGGNATTSHLAAEEICLNGVCITEWPTGGSGSAAWELYNNEPTWNAITPTTTSASIYVQGNATTTGYLAVNSGLFRSADSFTHITSQELHLDPDLDSWDDVNTLTHWLDFSMDDDDNDSLELEDIEVPDGVTYSAKLTTGDEGISHLILQEVSNLIPGNTAVIKFQVHQGSGTEANIIIANKMPFAEYANPLLWNFTTDSWTQSADGPTADHILTITATDDWTEHTIFVPVPSSGKIAPIYISGFNPSESVYFAKMSLKSISPLFEWRSPLASSTMLASGKLFSITTDNGVSEYLKLTQDGYLTVGSEAISGGFYSAGKYSSTTNDFDFDYPTIFQTNKEFDWQSSVNESFGFHAISSIYGFATSTDYNLQGGDILPIGVTGMAPIGIFGVTNSNEGVAGLFVNEYEDGIGLMVNNFGSGEDPVGLAVFSQNGFGGFISSESGYGLVIATNASDKSALSVVSGGYIGAEIYSQTGYGLYVYNQTGYGAELYSESGYGAYIHSQSGYGLVVTTAADDLPALSVMGKLYNEDFYLDQSGYGFSSRFETGYNKDVEVLSMGTLSMAAGFYSVSFNDDSIFDTFNVGIIGEGRLGVVGLGTGYGAGVVGLDVSDGNGSAGYFESGYGMGVQAFSTYGAGGYFYSENNIGLEVEIGSADHPALRISVNDDDAYWQFGALAVGPTDYIPTIEALGAGETWPIGYFKGGLGIYPNDDAGINPSIFFSDLSGPFAAYIEYDAESDAVNFMDASGGYHFDNNVTTTGSLWVSDIATLATSTMRLGSKFSNSDDASSIRFTDYQFGYIPADYFEPGTPASDWVFNVPIIEFETSGMTNEWLGNAGAMSGKLIVVEEVDGDGSDWPTLSFGSNDILDILINGSSADIMYSTTSDMVIMTSANYLIEKPVDSDDFSNIEPGSDLSSMTDVLFNLYKTNADSADLMFAVTTSTDGNLADLNTKFKIMANGDFQSDGALLSGHADYAEYFWTKDQNLLAGEAVCVDITRNNAVQRCDRGADPNVMGIVSTNPAVIGNAPDDQARGADYVIVGLLGQVPARASAENGAIRPGDSLTSSALIPGHVMKANPGDSTVGVALAGLDSGNGVINVLISRRNKSLTVEQIESQITDRIAEMEIEDEVNLLIASAVDNLNLDQQISDLVNPGLLLLDTKITLESDAWRSQLANTNSVMSQLQDTLNDLLLRSSTLENTAGSFEEFASSTQATLLGYASSINDLADADLTIQETLQNTSSTLSYLQTEIEDIYSLLADQDQAATTSEELTVTQTDLRVDTLIVQQSATFYGTLYVVGEAGFEHKVVFNDDIEVKGKIYASADQAGSAVITANATSTKIAFQKEYEVAPKVTITIRGDNLILYGIKDVTTKGFTIHIPEAQTANITFDWIALAVKGEGMAPVIDSLTASLSSVGFGVPLELWAQVSDPDTDSNDLTFTWSFEPSLGSLSGNSGLVYWTIGQDEVNENTPVTVTVEVSDGSNTVSQDTVITVLAATDEEAIVDNPSPSSTEPLVVLGCTDQSANNYNETATQDDGSCTYPDSASTPAIVILGCTDQGADNYEPLATQDDGSCAYPDPLAQDSGDDGEIGSATL